MDADRVLAFRLARSGLAAQEARDLAEAASCPASELRGAAEVRFSLGAVIDHVGVEVGDFECGKAFDSRTYCTRPRAIV